MRFCRVFIASIALSLSFSAQARVIENSKMASWSVFAYADNNTGGFSHCVVASAYRSGITLGFMVDKNTEWYMLLQNNNWKLTVGRRYNFDIMLDGLRGDNWFGNAATPEMIRIPLANQAGLFQKFRKSRQLTIDAVSGSFSFYLTDSSEALRSLVACALRHMQPGSTLSNPFEAQVQAAPETPAPASGNDALYAEAAVTVTNLLAEIGAGDHRLLSIDKVKSEFPGQHAVWATRGAIGALQIYTAGGTIEDLTSVLIAKSAADCKGKFATGKNSAEGNIRKIEVACEERGNLITYFYLVVTRPAGGNYIFTVFTADGAPSSRSEAARVSDMILAAQKK